MVVKYSLHYKRKTFLPMQSRASSIITSMRPFCTNSEAAERPAIPAPIITTFVFVDDMALNSMYNLLHVIEDKRNYF